MEKVKIKLCVGTMCYVMGGAQLLEIEDMLTEEEKEYVSISSSPCLQKCDNGKETPPFVEINGKVINCKSKENLLQIIKQEIKHVIR